MSYQTKVYRKQGGDEFVVASGGKITIESGGTLEAKSGASMSLPDIALEVGDLALASAKVIVGNAGGKAAAVDLAGDVTVDNAGAMTIGAGKVTDAMLANRTGLGGSVSVTKISAATDTVVVAHTTKDRACLVFVIVDEAYAIGTGTLPTVKIGEDDTIEKCMAGTVLDTEAAGTVLMFAFTNLATKKIIVTTTAAAGNATGGCSITVLAIPTT
jgi:hypothetical protein